LIRSRGSTAYIDAFSSRVVANAEDLYADRISEAEFHAWFDEARAPVQQQMDAERYTRQALIQQLLPYDPLRFCLKKNEELKK
jgi:hypothetical protein